MITTYSSLFQVPGRHHDPLARPSGLRRENPAGRGPWRSQGIRFVIGLVLCLLPLTGLLAGCSGRDLRFPTEYQAVSLDNGQVFFGRLTDTNSSFLMLRETFTIFGL